MCVLSSPFWEKGLGEQKWDALLADGYLAVSSISRNGFARNNAELRNRAFVADARVQRPTRIFVTGRLFTFEAPTNATTYQGLYVEVQSSQNIRLEAPNDQ
jgi:hypothetical protein